MSVSQDFYSTLAPTLPSTEPNLPHQISSDLADCSYVELTQQRQNLLEHSHVDTREPRRNSKTRGLTTYSGAVIVFLAVMREPAETSKALAKGNPSA
jgi:hypothetical protein